MATRTTNYNLLKPALSDTADITAMNQNWDKIDEELKKVENYLPLTGGAISGTLVIKDGGLKIEKGVVSSELYGLNNSQSGAHHYLDISHVGESALARLRMNIEENGEIYNQKHALQFRREILNGEGTWYNIFGEHNKPTGSYQGNGSATRRTVNIGGIGTFLLIRNDSNLIGLVTYGGGVIFSLSSKTTEYLNESAINFRNGVLTIATSSDFVNYNGTTYRYQVL